MNEKVTPMIHVPDVRATVDWYRDIGFEVVATYGNEGDGLSFAMVRWGKTEVMFNEGGKPSTERRREVDLYVYTDNLDDVYQRLKDRVEIVAQPNETFYGMREFIIRDCNRFWITFGQQTPYGRLMDALRERSATSVRSAIESGGLSAETLTAALAVELSADQPNETILGLLKQAGAVMPLKLEERDLILRTGTYRNDKGMGVQITLENGVLIATPTGQQPIRLLAIDQNTFRPIALDGVRITFIIEADKTVALALKIGSHITELRRAKSES